MANQTVSEREAEELLEDVNNTNNASDFGASKKIVKLPRCSSSLVNCSTIFRSVNQAQRSFWSPQSTPSFVWDCQLYSDDLHTKYEYPILILFLNDVFYSCFITVVTIWVMMSPIQRPYW